MEGNVPEGCTRPRIQSGVEPPALQTRLTIPPGPTLSPRRQSMLTMFGRALRCCDGLSRRQFLQVGALGTALSLADLLRADAGHKAAGRPARGKSAILV